MDALPGVFWLHPYLLPRLPIHEARCSLSPVFSWSLSSWLWSHLLSILHCGGSSLVHRVWWQSMTQGTWTFITTCPVCAWGKSSHQSPTGPLNPLPILCRPWLHIAVDFVSGLPPSNSHSVVLTNVDRFSKMAHFVPLPKLPSEAEGAFLHWTLCRTFTSQVWRSFCSVLRVAATLLSSYQSNGQTARANQTITMIFYIDLHMQGFVSFHEILFFCVSSLQNLYMQICKHTYFQCMHIVQILWSTRRHSIELAKLNKRKLYCQLMLVEKYFITLYLWLLILRFFFLGGGHDYSNLSCRICCFLCSHSLWKWFSHECAQLINYLLCGCHCDHT